MVQRIIGNTINYQLSKEAVRREIAKFLNDKTITVGIHEDAGMHKTEPGEKPRTMAEVGALNNYGDPHNTLNGRRAPVPARPFLIPGVESAIPDIIDAVAEALAEHRDLNQTLDVIGAFAAGGVQTYMTELKNPPNSTYTIEQKGSSNPLIDTGALRASITWKIENKKPEEGI